MKNWKDSKRRKDRNGWHNNSERSSCTREVAEEPFWGPPNELKILKREFCTEGGLKLDEAVWSRGLPDDVYSIILAHLPLSSFYQMRTVCKSWSLMPHDKTFIEACSRVKRRSPSLLLMGKDYCWTYEPAMNEWKSIPLSFFVPESSSDENTYMVSSAGGRVLLLRRCRLLLHNPLNKSLKLLRPMLDMDQMDLPTVFDIHITGMFASCDDDDGDGINILVMNKITTVDEEFDRDYEVSEPIMSQIYDSRADSWKLLGDFNPGFKLSVASAAMVEAKPRFVVSSYERYSRHHPRSSELGMYTVETNSWVNESIRMPNEGQPLVAPHLFTYEGSVMLVAALPTRESRSERFPTWSSVTVWKLPETLWKLPGTSIPRETACHWTRVLEIGEKELSSELWNTSTASFFFLSGGNFIYFGSRSGSSVGMIDLKSQAWRLLPSFPGIASHFGGGIETMSLQTLLFEPRFDLVV